MKFPARDAALAIALLVPASLAGQDAPRVETYREPEDPVVRVLADAAGRIHSDNPKDYTAEASERGLRDLDAAIAARPDDPRLHWYRSLTLARMQRPAEARAAREAAIRAARKAPGGDDLLREYYGEHAEVCAKEGDRAAAAASFLAGLDLDPRDTALIFMHLKIHIQYFPPRASAPGPGPLFPDRARLEALWGPLDRVIETHAGPADAPALARVAERVRAGMDYREAARAVGFPAFSMGFCHWDHGIPVMDACWHYVIERPTIVRDGNLIGAIPPADPTIVHVVIVDGKVRKVETTRGRPPEEKTHRHHERSSFVYPRSIIAGVAFSPDGGLVAAGDTNGAVHLREVRTGRESMVLRVPGVEGNAFSGWLRPVAFSPDGKTLAAGGLYDRTVRLWNVADGGLRLTIQVVPAPKEPGSMAHVESLAFAPDGKTLATAGPDRDVRLWDAATGRLVAVLGGHSYDVAALAFSPDGKTLASGDEDGNVRLWDVAARRPRDRWPGYQVHIEALAFSPDGKTLAVARGYDNTVRLRDVATGQLRAELVNSRPQNGQSLAFSPDGRTLAVAGAWVVVTLWDPATGRLTGVLEGHTRFPEAVAFSPDGKTIATGSVDDTLKLWDVPAPADRAPPRTLPRPAALKPSRATGSALPATISAHDRRTLGQDGAWNPGFKVPGTVLSGTVLSAGTVLSGSLREGGVAKPMNSEAAVRAFHDAIVALAVEKLGRSLTDQECGFITSRGGFIALEAILDTVRALPASEVARYLNSEAGGASCA